MQSKSLVVLVVALREYHMRNLIYKTLQLMVLLAVSVFVTASPIPVADIVARDTVAEVAREPICMAARC